MAAYRSFNHSELFLSLKRDLAMVSDSAHFFFIYIYLHFIAEVSFYHYYYFCSETRVALDARDATEAQLGALKDK